jgi:hypothetical protein
VVTTNINVIWQQLFYLHKCACYGVGGRSSMVSTVRDCAVRYRKEFQNRAPPLTWAIQAARHYSPANTAAQYCIRSRSLWSCGLRSGTAVARLVGLRFRTPPGTWMTVFGECCVLSGRGLCEGPTARPQESYRVWCV